MTTGPTLRIEPRAEPRSDATTICGKCETEWPTDTGRQVCPRCGNDGEIESHAVRAPKRKRGPQRVRPTKVAISLRLERSALDAYRATGRGWQSRMSEDIAILARHLDEADTWR